MEARRVVVKVRIRRPRLSRRVVSALLLALCLSVGLMPQAALAGHPEEGGRFFLFDEFDEQVRTPGGVVVSESAQASKAGLDVLDDGGNAVEAAIATTFAIGVTRPEMCGIGGGGFLVYRGADGTTAALDFRETAPERMNQYTFNEGEGRTDTVSQGIHNELSGHTVVGVPGVVAGMDEALNELGSGMSLRRLIAPAEKYAREGIRVTNSLQSWMLSFADRLANYPETARIYGGRFVHGPIAYNPVREKVAEVPGDPTAPGEPAGAAAFKQEDYAKSLQLIMEHGRDAFYKVGDYPHPILGAALPQPSIGKLIVEDMATAKQQGEINPVLLAKTDGMPNDIGLITKEDLESYEPVWRTPLVSHYRDHEVISMPPPAGGMVVTEILNLLENFDLSSFGHSTADHIHALAEAEKLAWADRAAYLADPDFENVPVPLVTNKGYAKQRAREIDMGEAKTVAQYGDGTLPPPDRGTHTTHISVIDRDGNAVAVTCSLELPFGSTVVAPGTGFVLNGQLDDFDWTWGNDLSAPANAPAGGKRPRSSMSPTIVVEDGQPLLVTGGAGGPTIIGGVVQNIVNVIDFGLDIWHAMDAARVDSVALPGSAPDTCAVGSLAVEQPRISGSVLETLNLRGHTICLAGRTDARNLGYANLPVIQSAGTDLLTEERLGASENRQPADNQGAMGQ